MHATGLAQCVGERVGFFRTAVDDGEFGDAGIEQGGRDAVRGAAGAEQERTTTAQVQAMAFGQVAHEADAVGVVALPVIAGANQGVHRAGPARAFAQALAQREGGLLVRQRDVGAIAAFGGETRQRGG